MDKVAITDYERRERRKMRNRASAQRHRLRNKKHQHRLARKLDILEALLRVQTLELELASDQPLPPPRRNHHCIVATLRRLVDVQAAELNLVTAECQALRVKVEALEQLLVQIV